MIIEGKSKPWEWMIKYKPQEDWIEGFGKLIWLALFFSETGAGLFLVSILFDNLWGMILGWIFCLIFGGGFFLFHMGHPFRSYRAVFKFRTSWISRGVTFISLLGIFGAMLISMKYFNPAWNSFLLIGIVGILCVLVAIYAGMLLSYVRAIPLWNSGLLPLSYIVSALWSGAEILLGIQIGLGLSMGSLELWIRLLLPSFGLIIIIYLISIWYSSKTGQASVKRIIIGDLAKYFYIGVLVGLLFPLSVVGYSFLFGMVSIPEWVIIAAIMGGIISDLSVRFCIIKGALYTPLI